MNKITKFIGNEFLSGMAVTVNQPDERTIDLIPVMTEENNKIVWKAQGDGANVTFTAVEKDGGAVFYADIKAPEKMPACAIDIKLAPECADELLASHHDNNWWMMGSWPKKMSEIYRQTQGFLIEKDGLHYSLMLLVGDVYRCECDGRGLHLDAGCNDYAELSGAFISVFADSDPIAAVEKNYKYAREMGVLNIPLREDRRYPEMFEKFGWCSWNAFYQEITSEKLYSKLEEFKAKNVPVKWIIIDDGWSIINNGKLCGFHADPEKFPEGLKECVRRIKDEYGIEKVGVWHTLNGYWGGIDPESDMAKAYPDSFITLLNGSTVPSDDPDKAFLFWDGWHGYLASCGIDFVKVDNQSSSREYYAWNFSAPAAARHAHEAIERSINKNFGGVVINCMGMDMDNVFARPTSAVSRNSDDFFPERENGFSKHLRQNLYNAVWHSQLYHCDYDMWWSNKDEAVRSGVLRSISGGPVYISDEVGGTEMEGILPVCGEDGDICRLDNAARPTLDCLYEDRAKAGKTIKAYNTKDDAIALAVFNIADHEVEETFTFDVIPAVKKDAEYVAYEYFTKKYSRVRFDTEEKISIEKDNVLSYSLYPIITEGESEYILLGNTDRYIGIGVPEKTKVDLKDIL